jgi:hypothetical protein
MKKVSVTYHAPKGDSKVCEAFGNTFYDGKAEDVTVEDYVYDKIAANRHFECGKPTDVSAADIEKAEAAKAEKADKEHKGR